MNQWIKGYISIETVVLHFWGSEKQNLALSTDRADIQVLEPGISPGFYFHVKQKKNMEPKELPSF